MSECGKDEFWLFRKAPRNLKERGNNDLWAADLTISI